MIIPILAGIAGLSLMSNPPKRKRRKARGNPTYHSKRQKPEIYIDGGEDGGDCDIVIEVEGHPEDGDRTYRLACDSRAQAKRLIKRGPAAVLKALEQHRKRQDDRQAADYDRTHSNPRRNPKTKWTRSSRHYDAQGCLRSHHTKSCVASDLTRKRKTFRAGDRVVLGPHAGSEAGAIDTVKTCFYQDTGYQKGYAITMAHHSWSFCSGVRKVKKTRR